MKTSKPISTISYNSESFLEKKIQYWKSQGFIEFGMWIKHKPDEDNKKEHFHVYLMPAKQIQTMFLELDSQEIDPNNPDKPLKMISFRNSKESDWLLYGIHDKLYLAQKGLTRNFHYDFSDVRSTCEDTLDYIISNCADSRKGSIEMRILELVEKGFTWKEIVKSGFIPLRYMGSALVMYQALTYQELKPIMDIDGEFREI